LPYHENLSEAEYFNIKNLTEVKKQALKLWEFFQFNYEDVLDNIKDIKEATKRGTLITCIGQSYLGEEAGITLYRNDGWVQYSHSVHYAEQENDVPDFNQIVPVINDIFDTYEPFLKRFYEKYPFKFTKVLYLTLKKTLNMTQIFRQTGQVNCYLYVEALDGYFAISDSDPILGQMVRLRWLLVGIWLSHFREENTPTFLRKIFHKRRYSAQ